jgi:hypothetical protein
LCDETKSRKFRAHPLGRKRLNPTFSQQQHSNKANTDSVKDEFLDDDNVCSAEMGSIQKTAPFSFRILLVVTNLLASFLALLNYLWKVITHVLLQASNVLPI